MTSPFPGMDPYLEDRALWNDVHHRFITYISNALQRQVRLRYHGRIEERLYVEEAKREIVPDTAVLQPVGSRTGTAVAQAPECDAPIVLQVETREHTEGVIHILDRAQHARGDRHRGSESQQQGAACQRLGAISPETGRNLEARYASCGD